MSEQNQLYDFSTNTVTLSTLVSALQGIETDDQPLSRVLDGLIEKGENLKQPIIQDPENLQKKEQVAEFQWYTLRILYNTAQYLSNHRFFFTNFFRFQ